MRSKRNPSKRITWVAESVGYRVLTDGRRSYCYRYRDAGGVQRCFFLGPGSTEKQAKQKLAEITVAKAKGEQVRVAKITFADYADKWLRAEAELVGVDITQSTYDTYEWNVEHRLKPYFGRRQVQKIDKQAVAEFIRSLKAKGYAGWTIRNAIVPLSGIFVEAVDQGLLAVNPVQQVSRKKREKPREDEQPKRILTIDEIDTLLAAARQRGLRWKALVAVFVFAGLRRGEALGLRWKDIDFEKSILRVRKQADRKTGALRDPKMGSKRDIPISTELRKALLEWKVNSRFVGAGDRVFSTATGTGISHRNAYRAVTDLALSCGINVRPEREEIPNLDIHGLRHVFASAAIKATKGDAERVAVWTGHSAETLLKHYSHEFEAARGGRKIEQDIAAIDAAYGG